MALHTMVMHAAAIKLVSQQNRQLALIYAFLHSNHKKHIRSKFDTVHAKF